MHHPWKSVVSLYSNILQPTYTSSNSADANKTGSFKHKLACNRHRIVFSTAGEHWEKVHHAWVSHFLSRSYRPIFLNERKKFSHFGQNVWKYILMNNVTTSFNTTVRQMTEMSHDQNFSAKNDRNVSAKKNRKYLSSGVDRIWTKGEKLSWSRHTGHYKGPRHTGHYKGPNN